MIQKLVFVINQKGSEYSSKRWLCNVHVLLKNHLK